MEMDEEEMVYFLNKRVSPFGIRISREEEMLIVKDSQKEMTIMYMQSGEINLVPPTRSAKDSLINSE